MIEKMINSRTLSAVTTIFLGLSMSACSTDRTEQETLQLRFPNQDLHQAMTTDELGNAAQSSDEAALELGIRLMNGDRTDRDLDRGYEIFKSLAEAGDARAQFFLGTAYVQGAGVEPDETIAVNWFEKSAEGGYDMGQYWYAFMLSRGRGVAGEDWKTAMKWFLKAAKQGQTNALFSMGEIHESCRAGLDRDFDRAANWYRRADGPQDSMAARFNLRRLIDLGLVEWQPGDPGEAPEILVNMDEASFTVCEPGAKDPLLE